MTKKELITIIANETKIQQDIVRTVVQKALDCLAEELSTGRNIELRNFGIFEIQIRKERKGRNPRAPEHEVIIPERAIVKFRAGKVLKERVETLTK